MDFGLSNCLPRMDLLCSTHYFLKLFLPHRRAGPPFDFILLPFTPKVAAPLFPGFGKGGRNKSQPLELLILSFAGNFLITEGEPLRRRPHETHPLKTAKSLP